MNRLPMPAEFRRNVGYSLARAPLAMDRMPIHGSARGGDFILAAVHQDIAARITRSFDAPDHMPLDPNNVPDDIQEEMAYGLWIMHPDSKGENFADVPVTISELKAGKSWNAADWKPRDAVIDLLRSIDSGTYPNIDAVVICWREKDKLPDGGYGLSSFYSVSAPDIHASLGLLTRTAFRINKSAEDHAGV